MRKDYISVRNLEEQGFDLRERNKVLPSGNETVKHFVVKALIGRILHERGYGFVTEAPISVNGSVAYIDVFDYSNGIAYEVQSVVHKGIKEAKKELFECEAIKDVIIVDLDEISNDIFIAYRQLQKIVV
ncbi:MAG: hypothetical protein QXE05_00935 [Nitrososphaeria archaeon]